MENKDYLLEVTITNYSMEYVHFEVLDLTTGKTYEQCFPNWIYQYSDEYIEKHTRFINRPEGLYGSYSINGFYSREARVVYRPTPGEQAYLDAINS